jgi:hypothetical protein
LSSEAPTIPPYLAANPAESTPTGIPPSLAVQPPAHSPGMNLGEFPITPPAGTSVPQSGSTSAPVLMRP